MADGLTSTSSCFIYYTYEKCIANKEKILQSVVRPLSIMTSRHLQHGLEKCPKNFRSFPHNYSYSLTSPVDDYSRDLLDLYVGWCFPGDKLNCSIIYRHGPPSELIVELDWKFVPYPKKNTN